jgi:hypothetical protein
MLAAAFLLACVQDAVVVTAGDAVLKLKDLELGVEGGSLRLGGTDAQGGKVSLKGEEVVEITLAGPPPAASKPGPDEVEIHLSSGDVWTGRLGLPAEDGIRLLSPTFGDPLVKFGQIRAVLFAANRAFLPAKLPEKAEAADLVLTRSGDRAEGTLLGLSQGGLTYKSKRLDAEVNLPLAQAAGLWLIETDPAPKDTGGLQILAAAVDGSTLRGEVQGLKGGVLMLKDLYGASRALPVSRLGALFVKNGRVVYLSDLNPAAVDEDANYIRGTTKQPSDLDYPFQKDRSARGTPIVLGGVEYRKGLGVRAHSALTYALGGAFARFQSRFGLDAVARGLAAVRAEVWVDGKRAYEAVLKGNDVPVAVDVDVKGAKELKLVVTWAGFGQSDFAGWGSARFLR